MNEVLSTFSVDVLYWERVESRFDVEALLGLCTGRSGYSTLTTLPPHPRPAPSSLHNRTVTSSSPTRTTQNFRQQDLFLHHLKLDPSPVQLSVSSPSLRVFSPDTLFVVPVLLTPCKPFGFPPVIPTEVPPTRKYPSVLGTSNRTVLTLWYLTTSQLS